MNEKRDNVVEIRPLPVPVNPFPQEIVDADRERIMRSLCIPRGFLGMALVLLLALLAGCGERYAEVESSTSWSGNFDGSGRDGQGNARVEMGNEYCLIVQKETTQGDLRVRIVNEGGVFLFWNSTTDWKSTSAAYGEVVLCADE